MRIITSGGLSAVFHGLLPPSLLELQLSVLQWSSVAPQGDIRSACRCTKRWLPGYSATVQILNFCTCFQDNWHLKGRLWLLTVCPWPALCLHLKTVGLNLWLFHYFSLKLSTNSLFLHGSWCIAEEQTTLVSCKLHVNLWNRRSSSLPCLVHFTPVRHFHWGWIWIVLYA